MTDLIAGQMDRRNKKRKRKAVEHAVNFFSTNVPNSRTDQCRYALRKIRSSGRPLSTAKALAKKFRAAPPHTEHQECPDLSAAQEARVSLIRRQHPLLQGVPAYEDELGSLERHLVTGEIDQDDFDKRCQSIAKRELPDWIRNFIPPTYPLPQSPIQWIPSDVLHKALGLSRPDLGQIGPLPMFLDRCTDIKLRN